MRDDQTTPSCDDVAARDALPLLLHDRLAPAERARTQAHVASCVHCGAELALLRGAGAVLRAQGPCGERGGDRRRRARRHARRGHEGAAAPPAEAPAALTVVRGDAPPTAARSARPAPAPAARRGGCARRPRRCSPRGQLGTRDRPRSGVGAHRAGGECARRACACACGAERRRRAGLHPWPSAERLGAGTAEAPPLLGDAFADLSDTEVLRIVAALDGAAGPALDPGDDYALVPTLEGSEMVRPATRRALAAALLALAALPALAAAQPPGRRGDAAAARAPRGARARTPRGSPTSRRAACAT
jgi:hypothetical protein